MLNKVLNKKILFKTLSLFSVVRGYNIVFIIVAQFQSLVTQQKNGGEAIIPFDEIVNTTKASFAAIESLKEGKWISIK